MQPGMMTRLLEHLPVGIFRTDLQGRCDYVNDRWTLLTGQNSARAQDDGWTEVIHDDDRERVLARWAAFAHGGGPFSEDFRLVRRDGSTIWVLGQATDDREGEELVGYFGTVTDISGHKRLELELRDLAATDFLTGLCNRRSFLALYEAEISRFQRQPDQPVSLLMLDLDHFKRVNDNYGHAAGDTLLRQFADLVSATLRRFDVAGRLGGEEFAVLLPGADLANARGLAVRLCEKVAAVAVEHEGQSIRFTVSIGVAEMTLADTSGDHLLEHADRALYEAKESGRNRVVVSDPR
ncbi:MAG: sensor domain-containing diguanylate cyclase [Spirochaetales bacterium]